MGDRLETGYRRERDQADIEEDKGRWADRVPPVIPVTPSSILSTLFQFLFFILFPSLLFCLLWDNGIISLKFRGKRGLVRKVDWTRSQASSSWAHAQLLGAAGPLVISGPILFFVTWASFKNYHNYYSYYSRGRFLSYIPQSQNTSLEALTVWHWHLFSKYCHCYFLVRGRKGEKGHTA